MQKQTAVINEKKPELTGFLVVSWDIIEYFAVAEGYISFLGILDIKYRVVNVEKNCINTLFEKGLIMPVLDI